MSQPCDRSCTIPQPGETDEDLGEFWEGSHWKIFQQHNLSSYERNRVFLNVRGGNFLDVSALSAADSDGDGRAVVAADFNGDGRVDLAVRQAGGGPLLLFENQLPQKHYLKVTLRGTESNRLAVGARLTAHVAGRRIVRETYPLNSYRSQAPLIVHFGLGDAERVDRLTVRWPSGKAQQFDDLPADRHYLLTEGSRRATTIEPGVRITPSPSSDSSPAEGRRSSRQAKSR